MYKDQSKDVSKDAVELPQIRFPIKGTKNATEQAADRDDMEKLTKIVEGAFKAIANATGLSEKEVRHAMEDVHVDMLKDVLKDDTHADVLRKAIQEAIKTISLATDLDTEQISDIFSAKRDASLNDIVSRLHDRTQTSREKFGSF